MHLERRILCLAPVLSLGCVTMAGNRLEDSHPTAAAAPPAIEQTVGDFSFHLVGGKMVTSNKMGRTLNDEILNRWIASGYISSQQYVKSSEFSGSSNYQLTLSGHQEGDSSILLQVISGLTLTAIPYYVDTKMDLKYQMKRLDTGCLFSASASDSFNTVVGLLMLPAAPFGQGGRTRTFDRIAAHLFGQLAEQGAFSDHEPCIKDKASRERRLEELESLRVNGLISEDEYLAKRKQVLNEL